MKKLCTAVILLSLWGTNVQAAQSVAPDVRTTVKISNHDVNRFVCPGNMQDMIYSKEKDITLDSKVLNMYKPALDENEEQLLANLAPGGKIDEHTLEELESMLVMADVGIDTTTRIIEDLQKSLARKELTDLESLRNGLQRSIVGILEPVELASELDSSAFVGIPLAVAINLNEANAALDQATRHQAASANLRASVILARRG